MRAVVMREFGPPEVLRLEAVDEPEGEALVEVAFASVTFVETMVRAGRAPHSSMEPALPAILGNGVAGTVDGARVVTTTGGLGTLLVQLARSAGARVIAAAGGERKLALARELGADQAVDYLREGWARGLEADVVFDGVGGAMGSAAFTALRPGGAKIEPEEAHAREVELVSQVRPTPEESAERTRRALAEAAAGRLRPVLGQVVPLAAAAAAHAAIEARAVVGKTLLASTG